MNSLLIREATPQQINAAIMDIQNRLNQLKTLVDSKASSSVIVEGGGNQRDINEADYEALSDKEKDSDTTWFVPDSEGVDIEPVDEVTEGNMSAVTSNAVSKAISSRLADIKITRVTVQITQTGNTYIPLSDLGITPSKMGNALALGCMLKYNTGESYYQQHNNPPHFEYLINQEYLRIIIQEAGVFVNTPLQFIIAWW